MHIRMMIVIFILESLFLVPAQAVASDLEPIRLMPARIERGLTVMQALKLRQSSRQFSPKDLPLPVLSDLLWAAWGVNRPDSGKRTAPSPKNWQEIDVYVVMQKGVYLYNAQEHTLEPVRRGDIRKLTGNQRFVDTAPVNLIFVADFSKIGLTAIAGTKEDDKEAFGATDAAFISQNVYLYCASEGLATVARGDLDRNILAKAMKLRPHQRIVFAQTVGYPQ